MPTHHARPPLLAVLATLLVAGCATDHFSSQPPPRPAIAGDWKLDRAASDRLSGAIARLSAELRRAAHDRHSPRGQQVASEAGPPGAGVPKAGDHRRPPQQQPEVGPQDVGGPGAGLTPAQEFLASVPAGDYLRLRVGPGEFTVVAGDASAQYTPGVESFVESSEGQATQNSGWKGGTYVIDTKPQLGPELIQSFEVTKDGKLAMRIRLRGKDADLTFTRVYERTQRVAPLAPPSN